MNTRLKSLGEFLTNYWLEILLILFFAAALLVFGTGCVSSPFRVPQSSPQIGPGGIVAPGATVTSQQIASVVTKQVWLFWIGGLLCLAAGGAMIYFSQYMAGLKLILAGLILPIAGTWWSEHYALIIAGTLVALAIWYFLTHQAARSAVAVELEKIPFVKKNL